MEETMQNFPRIERKSVSDQVFDVLKQYIVEGTFAIGEKIPSENELTRMLGVSRPSVKAAVERLRAMGLIEVRVGDGSYVKHFSTSDYIENWADFVSNEGDMSDLMEFRGAMELDSLELAIQRATDSDLAKLKELSEQLVDAFKRNDEELGVKYDMEFHLQICRCSKNKYFVSMYKLIGNLIFNQIRRLSLDVHADPKTAFVFDDHVQIYEAIRDRDLERGRDLLTKHILRRDAQIEALKNNAQT